jgi:hypothetical protein
MRTVCFVAFLAVTFFGQMVAVSQIGKERKPLEAGAVVISFVLSAGFVAAVWYLWVTRPPATSRFLSTRHPRRPPPSRAAAGRST